GSGDPTDEERYGSLAVGTLSRRRRPPSAPDTDPQAPTPPAPGRWKEKTRPRGSLEKALFLGASLSLLAGLVAILAFRFIGWLPFAPSPSPALSVLISLPPKGAPPGNEMVPDNGKSYHRRIEYQIPDGPKVPFVFVEQHRPDSQVKGLDIRSFYIMENKVSI